MDKLSLLHHCIKCGAKCCQASPLFLEKDKRKLEKIFPKAKFKKKQGFYLINQEPCYFLKNKQCSIQDIKPQDCRMWPLSFSVVNGKKAWTVDKRCLAVPHLTRGYINEAKRIAKKIPLLIHERYRREYESKHLPTKSI